MHIKNNLSVYWRETDAIQIGLDPRVGVVLEDLSLPECQFVDVLTRDHSEVDVRVAAKRLRVSSSRASEIVSMLRKADVLDEDPPVVARELGVEFPVANALATSIALVLTSQGVRLMRTTDRSPVSALDHPAFTARHMGLPREQAFVGTLRAANSSLTWPDDPRIAIVTGSHLIDPVLINDYLSRGIAVLTVWSEEVDVYVGPLKVGRQGSCSNCLYSHRADVNLAWNRIAPQALGAREVAVDPVTRELAASLAARTVLTYMNSGDNQLESMMWKIPPAPDVPHLVALPTHSRCGCAGDLAS